MEGLKRAIEKCVEASSSTERKSSLKKAGKEFYKACLIAGMKREQILEFATEIIDCFTEDIKVLKKTIAKDVRKCV